MKRFLALSMILGITSFGMIGCGEEAAKEEPKPAEAAPAAPGAPGEAAKPGEAAPAAPAAPAETPATPPAEAPK
jgi:hypothetical protein